ncbi:hypothetical protein K2X30_15605 [bacterium]|nr:hypothetical protein [bacterium]
MYTKPQLFGTLGEMRGLWFFLILFAANAYARDVRLFERKQPLGPSEPIQDYQREIRLVEPGDAFVFSDGTRIQIIRPISRTEGRRDFIFEGVDKKGRRGALRIPADDTRRYTVDDTVKGAPLLKKNGVPFVPIVNKGLPGEFTMTQLLSEGSIIFSDFAEGKYLIPATQKREMIEALKEFGKKVALLTLVKDMHQEQLSYDPERKQWVLHDWADAVEKVSVQGPNRNDLAMKYVVGKYVQTSLTSTEVKPAAPQYQWIADAYQEIVDESYRIREAKDSRLKFEPYKMPACLWEFQKLN